MSVLKNKRNQSPMEYVTNGYAVEKYSIDFTKRLSTKNARIYQKPVTRLAMLQSDLAYMANEIYPTNRAEYQVRRALLGMSMAILHALDKRMSDVYENLMVNPSDAFNRQNGKPIPKAEAIRILDRLADELGDMIDKQDSLLKGVRDSDKERFSNLPPADPEIANVLSGSVKALADSFMGLFF